MTTATQHERAAQPILVAATTLVVLLTAPFFGLGVVIAVFAAFTWLRNNRIARWALIALAVVILALVYVAGVLPGGVIDNSGPAVRAN